MSAERERWFDEGDEELDPEVTEALELLAEMARSPGEAPRTAAEIVSGFVERTPSLGFAERAELLGRVMEDQRSVAPAPPLSLRPAPIAGRPLPRWQPGPARWPPGRPGPGAVPAPPRPAPPGPAPSTLDQLASAVRSGLDVLKQGAQALAKLGPTDEPGGGPVAARPAPPRAGEVPPLPGPTPVLAPDPAAPSPAPTFDATALLALMLANPDLQRALQSAAVLGPDAPRAVQLELPDPDAPGEVRTVSVPLGAAMNALSALAERSMAELNAATREDDPEVPDYLVGGEGEFLVDPASPEERSALVAHLFRASRRSEQFTSSEASDGAPEPEADSWAQEAGWPT